MELITVHEGDLEPVVCGTCGEGNVIDGNRKGCGECGAFLAAIEQYRTMRVYNVEIYHTIGRVWRVYMTDVTREEAIRAYGTWIEDDNGLIRLVEKTT